MNSSSARPNRSIHGRSLDQQMRWMLSNLLIVAGLYLLAYVGGVSSYVSFQREAARGDSLIEAAPILITDPGLNVAPALQPDLPPVPATTTMVVPSESISAPEPVPVVQRSTVERVILPTITVDAKVIEVGWDILEQDGLRVAVWQVAEFAVGQHKGSANPGEGSNIVLSGHVGGFGQVFRDLFYLRVGDPVILYSQGQRYLYTVSERLIVQEQGISTEQQVENAQLIAPTEDEQVTMVTCWPAYGPEKFSQRVVIRALPPRGLPADTLDEIRP